MSRHDHDSHDLDDDDDILPSAENLSGKYIVEHTLLKSCIEQGIHPTHLIFTLDGTVHSHLDWGITLSKAQEALQQGYGLVFRLSLGLFTELKHPLQHPGQFQALSLSCRHFRKDVVEKFGKSILGVILYQGDVPLICEESHGKTDFLPRFHNWLQERSYTGPIPTQTTDVVVSPELRWNYTRFCLEECIDYLRLLSFEIPDTLHRFVLFDASKASSISSLVVHTAKDLIEPLHAVIQSKSLQENLYPISSSVWNYGYGSTGASFVLDFQGQPNIVFKDEDSFSTALLLPSYSSMTYEKVQSLLKLIDFLSEKQLSHRIKVVHEPFFTTEWHGVDRVIVSKKTLTSDGLRTLMGFSAAGGEVIDIDTEKVTPWESII